MVEGCKHNHATQMTQCHPERESTKNKTHSADPATSTASDQPAPERGSSWLGRRACSLRAVRREHSQEMLASSRSTGKCPSQWPVAHTQCAIEKRIMHDAEGTTTHTLSLSTDQHAKPRTNTQTNKHADTQRQCKCATAPCTHNHDAAVLSRRVRQQDPHAHPPTPRKPAKSQQQPSCTQ